MSEQTYKVGQILVLESGEYSDFSIEAILVTLKAFDISDLAKMFWSEAIKDAAAKRRVKPNAYIDVQPASFVGWLVAKEYCAPVQYSSLHIGSYGELSVGDFRGCCYDVEELADALNESTPDP